MLTRLAHAMQEVQSGRAKFTVQDGRREYAFDGFSILTAQ